MLQMTERTALFALALAGFLFAASPLAAAPAENGNGKAETTTAEKAPPQASIALPADSVTEHRLGEGPDALAYTATAGTLPLTDDEGENTAKIFYVAYRAEGENRPISFVFNGGPGAASAFLHLTAIGPRVLDYTDHGSEPVRPIKLRDNPDSWLPFTDLVFIDPVGTGFSRGTGSVEDAGKAYYGVEKDADAMTAFVRLFLTRNGRELAPVYVVGESYGGFRAALVTHSLLEDGIRVKGAMLISPALEFSMIRGGEHMVMPLALQLPAIAASHLERSKGYDAPLDPVFEAEKLARSEYVLELAQGPNVSEEMIDRLSRLTGIEKDVVTKHHGRVDADLFRQEIRRTETRAVSVYDGSITAPLPQPSSHSRIDPILDKAITVLTPLMVNYAREELKFQTDRPYTLLNRHLNSQWDYGTKPNRQGYAGSLDELQEARTLNTDLKVFVAHGYTDLATPYSVSRYLIDRLLPLEQARPVVFKVYRGGHMMYMRPGSRAALTADARALYEK